MNLDRRTTRKKIKKLNSPSARLYNKMGVLLYKAAVLLLIFALCVGGCFAYGAYKSIINGTPTLSLDDVTPSGYASTMYDSDGNVMLTLVQEGSNRTKVSYSDLPDDLVNAFIAIEDERFMTHNGIDLKGILRAGLVGITTFHFSEGASTITQQLIKNNIFQGGTETSFGAKMERKIQEQYLALQLESLVGKEWILENYLNTINLGNNTLGVQSAATRYFNKEVSDLTLSECAVIAAITQNPSYYNPIRFPDNNRERQLVVLQYMLEQELISQEEYDEAVADNVYDRIQNVSSAYTRSAYSYFEDAVIEEVINDLQSQLGYSQTQAYNLLYSDGLHIYTTQNTEIQQTMDDIINNPDNYPVTRYTCSYYLKLLHADGTVSNYSENDITNYYVMETGAPAFKLLFDTEEELYEAIEEFKTSVISDGDSIQTETITLVLEPQVSMTIIDNRTGYVVAISGGRGDKTNSLSLNRATDSPRSPGSCFKVIADFAPAIDLCGATLASTYYDSPLTSDEYSFVNWWGSGYVGYSNVHQAIIYSMNLVSVKCLLETVTPSIAFKYATNFGISTLVESRQTADGQILSDIVPSICLGGLTDGVTNLELTAAYETIANGGVYTEPIFYTKVTDSNGKVLLSNEQTTRTVLKPSTATLLTTAMEDVFSDTAIYTAPNANGEVTTIQPTCVGLGLDNMSCAGKSGSTTSNNDVWFVGYTPYYTCGIWSGYDDSISFGSGQTFHKEIWRDVMNIIHEDLEDIGFTEYAPLETARICSKSGLLAIDGVCDAEGSNSIVYEEYFAEGTAPTEYCNCHVKVSVCTESEELAGDYCPDDLIEERVYMLLDPSLLSNAENGDAFTTYDELFLMPAGLADSLCTVHDEDSESEDDEQEDEDSSSGSGRTGGNSTNQNGRTR